jgi:hypothetical protein
MTYTWKILGIQTDGDLITEARYFVVLKDGDFLVETEGNWRFQEPKLIVPLSEVTEEMVAQWVEQETFSDGKQLIKNRLAEQLQTLKNQKTVVAPWLPQVFTPDI